MAMAQANNLYPAVTVADFVERGRGLLAAASLQCADPLLHMKQIVAAASGWEMSDVYLNWNEPLAAHAGETAQVMLARRLTGEPFQYIVGYEWFWNSQFAVGPGALIPRRETEHLVEEIIRLAPPMGGIGELGAGTGNIGISVLQERSDLQWHTFEINPQSLPFLQKNAEALLPPHRRYSVHHGDFFEGAAVFAPYDLIVSNPPYVSSPSWNELPKEVKFEPVVALDGGNDGTSIIERLMIFARKALKPSGIILLEIGSDQEAAALSLARRVGLEAARVTRDYAGLPRIFCARNPLI